MNERIQELYRKVLHESAERWNHPDAEKFAELIVRECLDNCMAANDRDRIREHFGIKE
jgi:hypothetical protein